jgi:transposase
MTIVEAPLGITGGVDTDLDTHVAAALDPLGRLVGTESFDADAAGYKSLLDWLEGFGQVTKIGVEGTDSYGTGLARFLRRKGVEVVEVDRQNRQARRSQGKSDTLDAVEAARAAISGRATGKAKAKDGTVEAIRVLVVAKRSARQARVKAIVQMRHLGLTAPDQIQSRLKGLSVTALGAESARFHPTRSPDPVTAATKASLSSLAHRVKSLDVEIAELDEKLEPLLFATAPDLQASSGKVARHRLNRGDDRQANRAPWIVVISRLASDPETQAYMERRVKEGRSKREVIRMLKRYVAREVYRPLPRG